MASSNVLSAERLIVTPYSQRALITSRPPTGRSRAATPGIQRSKTAGAPDLTSVNAVIADEVTKNFSEIKKLFQIYDRTDSGSVTKSDLRRVLAEGMGLKLTNDQFAALCAACQTRRNGTVDYNVFLESRFNRQAMAESDKWLQLMHKRLVTQSPQEDVSMEKIERNLREKIGNNLKNIIRAFYLFDYNRDSHVQKHEMRKVLENYCFRLTDSQFDRLWGRYDLTRSGVTNYREFLQRLGVNVDNLSRPVTAVTSPARRAKSAAELRTGDVEPELMNPYQNKTFPEIEREFRRLMKRNMDQIVKTCKAYDAHREGYISLENMRNILSRFTLPLSESLFNKILSKLGFKATGKLAWASFLDYFAEVFRESEQENSLNLKPGMRTLPHKSNNSEKLTATQVINMLQQNVERNFSSIKAAFLAFDPERKGRIFRPELKRVIENFCCKITDDQFKELVILLDPNHDGFIDYQAFLNLFEMKEDSEKAHQWLNSEHVVVPVSDPKIAFQSIEEIMREKLSENAEPLAKSLARIDRSPDPRVSKSELSHLLSKHALPVSNEHVDELWSKLQVKDGRVRFGEVLKVLGVDASPDTGNGLSALITKENQQFLQERAQDHELRLQEQAAQASLRSNAMSLDEVAQRIRENIYQRNQAIREEFHRFDGDRDGKVTKSEFKKILSSLGLTLDYSTFEELCEALAYPRDGMTYNDFLYAFQDSRTDGPGAELERGSNYTKASHVPDVYQRADVVVPQLKNKILTNNDSLRDAFYKGDHGRKGYWDRNDFRKLLDKHMFFIDKEQFDRLMQLIGVSQKGRILYKDFVNLFQDQDSSVMFHESSHTVIDPTDPKELAAEQVYEIMKSKASGRYPDLTRAFQSLGKDSMGSIGKSEFRKLLWKFNLPISQAEFDKLWLKYDPKGVGSVNFGEFSRLMGVLFKGSDDRGTSTQLIQGNCEAVDAHIEGQKNRQLDITDKQMLASRMSAPEIEKQLRERFSDNFTVFYRAFREADVRRDGYIRMEDLYNILVKHNYIMDVDTFYQVLSRLGINTDMNKVNYERFLSNIDSTKKKQFIPKSEEELLLTKVKGVKDEVRSEHWSPNKVVAVMKTKVPPLSVDLLKAFQSFDPKDTGRINATDFRRVIENFCFKLSDQQFKGLLANIHLYQDLTVSYLQFLDNFVPSDGGDKTKFSERMRLKTPVPENSMGSAEVIQRLREIVTARSYDFGAAFKELDYGQLGLIRQQDFRAILHELAFRILDQQFEKVVALVSTDAYGNVDYRDFLKQFCTEGDVTPSSQRSVSPQPAAAAAELLQRPKSGINALTSRRPASAMRRSQSAMSMRDRAPSPKVTSENAGGSTLEQMISKHWRSMQNYCRSIDEDNTGLIQLKKLSGMLSKYNIELDEDDFRAITSHFMAPNDMVSYAPFLKSFMVPLRSGKSRSQKPKLKLPQAKTTKQSALTEQLTTTLEKIQDIVTRDWKTMRRTFKFLESQESGHGGRISIAGFRKGLKMHRVVLSEDEICMLCDYFDAQLTGKVSYNDFLRIFLQ